MKKLVLEMFINETEHDNVYIDKIGLEDLITSHDAQIETIDGHYYNDGRNETINHVIEYVYNVRLKSKRNYENPAQMVITLRMKSMYGTTIIKPIETYTVVKDNQTDFEKYMSYNYNYIESVLKVDDRYHIEKVKSILSHYNYVHCGVKLLSMSKPCNELCVRCI